jgi:hypothetical protein
MSQIPSPAPDIAVPNGASAAATPAPLTTEQLQAIQQADKRAAKIRRAMKIASADAYIMAFFAAIVAISIPFDYIAGIPLAIAFAFFTYNSFRGAGRMKRFDSTAPRLLAWNQIGLATAIILYAIYRLIMVMRGSSLSSSELAELGPEMSGDIESLAKLVLQILYIGLIVGTIIAQGLTALYYATRTRLIRDYLAQTPDWVVDLQKRQASV